MEGETNNPQKRSEREEYPQWIRVLFVIMGIVLFVLIIRAGRRGGAGLLVAAALPATASIAMATRPRSRPSVNQCTLQRSLEEIAAKTPQLTPTELFDRLQAYDLGFASVQEMGRMLRELGLQSHVDYVSGRSERRWYRLDRWRADESD